MIQQELVDLFHEKRYADLELRAHQLITLYTDFAPAWNFLGVARLGQGKDALQALSKAAELTPNDPTVQNNLGNALKKHGQYRAAADCFARAVALRPDYARAYLNLGAVSLDLKEYESAVGCCLHALSLQPRYIEALINLGAAYRELGRLVESVDALNQALTQNPEFSEAHLNLGLSQIDLGQFSQAEKSIRRAIELQPENFAAHAHLLFFLLRQPDRPAAQILEDALRFGDSASKKSKPFESWTIATHDPNRRLRVGFVSGDFREHSVGQFIESVFSALAGEQSDQLEVLAYSSSFVEDARTARIRANCKEWRSTVEMTDEELAKRIRADQVDVLIDLAGHTTHNRLPMFGWKPAPVQVAWLGYLGTTGMRQIDYLIADRWTLPESLDSSFSERIYRMPSTYLCFTPPDTSSVGVPPSIRNGYVTFGSFNEINKLNDRVLVRWAEILARVPNSRLLLKTGKLADQGRRSRLIDFFSAQGISPERLELIGFLPRHEHLPTYNRIDIALDPYPYPGITTTVEALWMGVPVISLVGDSFISRQGVGLLTNAGLPDWLAPDEEAYVSLAVKHASDSAALQQVRAGLRTSLQGSLLLDQKRFAADFSHAVREMWLEWRNRAVN